MEKLSIIFQEKIIDLILTDKLPLFLINVEMEKSFHFIFKGLNTHLCHTFTVSSLKI